MLDDWRGQEEDASVAVQIDRASDRLDPRHRRLQLAATRVLAASSSAPTSAPASAAAAATRPRRSSAAAGRRHRAVTGVQGRQRQPADVQRPADRGAAPAARAGLRGADRRARQRRSRSASRRSTTRRCSTRRPSTNSFDAYVFDPQWMGDFVGPGLPAGPDRQRSRTTRSSTGRTSARSSATTTRPTTARSTPSRSMATSTWSITGATCSKGRPQAAGDLGRLPDDREEVPGPGPQRRRPARLRLVHREEEGRPELLVDHLGRGRAAPEPGHEPGRVLRHQGHDPAVRPERGDDQGPRPYKATTTSARPTS